MLAPNSRLMLLEALRPPSGFRVDAAVGTTFTLSLDALLIPPAAWVTHSFADRIKDVDPIMLANSLRLLAERTTVFHQAGAASPLDQDSEELSAFLDGMVYPVSVRAGSTFHPKVWVLRFVSDRDEVGLRVLIGSRNLSLDSTWDVLVKLDSTPEHEGTASGKTLSDFLLSLPGRSTVGLSPERRALLESLAEDVRVAHFAPPPGADTAEILWWSTGGRPADVFPATCTGRLVASPFLASNLLSTVPTPADGGRSVLISRSAAFLPEYREHWETFTMATDLLGVEKGEDSLLGSEMHAKVFAFDEGERSTLIVGSANATSSAFSSNDEVVVRLTGPRSQLGVDALLGRTDDAGEANDDLELIDILQNWLPSDEVDSKSDEQDGRHFEEAIRLVASVRVIGTCEPLADDRWRVTLQLDQPVELPPGFGVQVRMMSRADPLPAEFVEGQPVQLELALDEISRFLVARFQDTSGQVEAQTVVLVVDLDPPQGRERRVLRSMLTDSDKFARFLRYLLESARFGPDDFFGGGDDLIGRRSRRRGGSRHALLDQAPVLEQLLRLLSGSPEELRHLDAVLREFADEKSILPDGFEQLWSAVAPLIPKGDS